MNSIIDHQNHDWLKEIKHTPGPWTPDEIPDGFNSIIIEHEGFPICTVRAMDDVVCELDDEYSAIAEFKGNAELISKAPDMLALLNDMAEALKAIIPLAEQAYTTHKSNSVNNVFLKEYTKRLQTSIECVEKYNKLFSE